jgi:hypothetical protein
VKSTTHSWTVEKLSALDLAKLKIVRENAERGKATELVAMCDSEIGSRKPLSPLCARKVVDVETGDLVAEFHFVCRNDRGVTFNSDGTFWSASWVVAEEVVQKSMKYGAKLPLHNSKAELSYRQGTIKDYRRIDDFAEGEVESRTDFLVVPDDAPLAWAGSGTGERGYKRVNSSGMPAVSTALEGETR